VRARARGSERETGRERDRERESERERERERKRERKKVCVCVCSRETEPPITSQLNQVITASSDDDGSIIQSFVSCPSHLFIFYIFFGASNVKIWW